MADISGSSPKYVNPSSKSCFESIGKNSIIDNLDTYNIDTKDDFTRAFEIVLVTKIQLSMKGKLRGRFGKGSYFPHCQVFLNMQWAHIPKEKIKDCS